jgi:hypothetical protein
MPAAKTFCGEAPECFAAPRLESHAEYCYEAVSTVPLFCLICLLRAARDMPASIDSAIFSTNSEQM